MVVLAYASPMTAPLDGTWLNEKLGITDDLFSKLGCLRTEVVKMSTNSSEEICCGSSHQRKFGICDDLLPPAKPAYINDNHGEAWIAVVHNNRQIEVEFVDIDNYVKFSKKEDGKDKKRCDVKLFYEDTVIFPELKDITENASNWTNPEQLLSTTKDFEQLT